ncbi:MAG: hypothetical protein LBE13_00065 [Bacteroidales bacterium]|jgi:hypothetical protein|nr:hypothetical protein [Bacteroidales bacterium]
MKVLNINFLQRKKAISNNTSYVENKIINILLLICIPAFIMTFLVSCGTSLNCNDSTIKSDVLDELLMEFENQFGKNKTKLIRFGGTKTISEDDDSCKCEVIVTAEISGKTETIQLSYSAHQNKKGEISVYNIRGEIK